MLGFLPLCMAERCFRGHTRTLKSHLRFVESHSKNITIYQLTNEGTPVHELVDRLFNDPQNNSSQTAYLRQALTEKRDSCADSRPVLQVDGWMDFLSFIHVILSLLCLNHSGWIPLTTTVIHTFTHTRLYYYTYQRFRTALKIAEK